MRVCAVNGTKRGLVRRELALAQPVLLGEHDDRAALGRLVGQRGQLRGLGQLGLGDARHRDELRRLAVAERDRAGLVEQQHVDVAGRLDRAARRARARCGARGGPCRRCRSRYSSAPIVVGISATSSAMSVVIEIVRAGEARERPQRHDDDEEDQRQAGEQDARARSRSGVLRRSAPSTSAIMRSRNDCPGSCVISTTMRSRQHARAAGDGAAVAAGLADDGRRLAGDRRLVDRGDALDDGAVAGDHLAGLDDDDVAAVQLGRRRASLPSLHRRGGLGAHRAQRVGLGLAAALGERLGEVGEDDGQPQPDRDGEREPARLVAAAERLAAEDWMSQATVVIDGADLDDEHHRVADLDARVELAQRRRGSPAGASSARSSEDWRLSGHAGAPGRGRG